MNNNNKDKIYLGNKYYSIKAVKTFRNIWIVLGVLTTFCILGGVILALIPAICFLIAFTYNNAIKKFIKDNQSTSPSMANPQATITPVSSHQTTTIPVTNPQATTTPVSSHQTTTIPVTNPQTTTTPVSSYQTTTILVTNPQATIAPVSSNQETTIPMQYEDTRILHALPKIHNGIPIAYEYTDVKICLIKGQEPDLTAIQVGSIIKLEQEPLNQYDNKAVMLKIGTTKIGYMYRGKLQDMANDFLKRNEYIVAYVSKIDAISNEIFMNMGFYRKQIKHYRNSTTFKLTGNTNKNMQEIIQCVTDDYDVEFYYDYEKEKFCASVFGSDIGYAPKSKNELLEACEEDYEAFIESIEENDNGKYVVSVTVKY